LITCGQLGASPFPELPGYVNSAPQVIKIGDRVAVRRRRVRSFCRTGM
jgi:hypothetical protein